MNGSRLLYVASSMQFDLKTHRRLAEQVRLSYSANSCFRRSASLS